MFTFDLNEMSSVGVHLKILNYAQYCSERKTKNKNKQTRPNTVYEQLCLLKSPFLGIEFSLSQMK